MSDFINKNGKANEAEINTILANYKSDTSLLFCIYTTKFCCTEYHPIEDISHALEIRLFNESGELKAVRANIGQDFVWRYISDENISEDCTYDEIQYLDAAKNDSTDYISIGGGHYEMPDAGYERVHIRHYGKYNADGMFELKDFRLVKLLRKGGGMRCQNAL